MQEIEPTWAHVRSIWWLLLWRAQIGGILIAGLVGFVIGFVGALLGLKLAILSSIVGLIVGVVWSLFVVRMALRKQYRGFRVALLAT